jgi:predicted enzyme related to lactoylglutathione lyase
MAEFTIPKPGTVCWWELRTKDLAKAKDFYAGLTGCKLEESKVSTGEGYVEIHLNDKAIGGMMPITESWGEHWKNIPSHWVAYIAVENCDETAAKIVENGGKIMMPPFDNPGVGRMASASDPSGAVFSIIQFVDHR